MTFSVRRKLHRLWYRNRKAIVGGVLAVMLIILYKAYWGSGIYVEPEVEGHACAELETARFETNIETLLHILKDPNDRQVFAWIRMRIQQMWPKWVKAVISYQQRTKLLQRTRKKILVFIGALTKESRRNLVERQFKGGYLGELLQWADLIAGLYLLGHDVTVISETDHLRGLDHFFAGVTSKCDRPDVNSPLLYTDIFGVRHLRKRIKESYNSYKCKLRVLDVFGTDPAWNDKMFAFKHNRTSFWGGLELNTQQFYTMYPENPDNSFIGFAVDTEFSPGQEVEKDFSALVYGKSPELWKGKTDYLRVFDDAGFNLYATVNADTSKSTEKADLPSFVNNVGILHGEEFKAHLKRAKVFIGLGSPIEGPAPMEALAHGAVYINPKLEGEVNLTSRRRVTERVFASQTPYTETAIGGPYVYTVSMDNKDRLKQIADMLMKRDKFTAVLPYEFSPEGYIQRLNVFIEKQNFCQDEFQRWPPDEHVTTYHFGEVGQSCTDVCKIQVRICEPSHFIKANTLAKLKTNQSGNLECVASRLDSNIFFPAIDWEQNYCVLQRNRKLFSCAGSSPRYQRLCPCRDFMKGQQSLCRSCDL